MKPGDSYDYEHSPRSKNTGILAMGTLDRDLKELASTKGLNFAHLIHRYTFRRDSLPNALTLKKPALEVMCRLNQRVCKKAGLKELALSWRSLSTLGHEIIEAKRRMQTVAVVQ